MEMGIDETLNVPIQVKVFQNMPLHLRLTLPSRAKNTASNHLLKQKKERLSERLENRFLNLSLGSYVTWELYQF